ncbi:85/88 kDa calcium-independent phospholipase A2-like [Pecten maximus]|uniref:85/88 kDa calcium-independent phospholipase A2-like n=1 Tax=Pecten maximus TaxID=6579 RepID=UPI001458FE85|nr:85/88 kDa calcium-independent phospholipase A2-like [Pecten maximus]
MPRKTSLLELAIVSWTFLDLHSGSKTPEISSQNMAGFFKQVVGGIKGIVDAASANISPFKVQVVKPEDHSGLTIRNNDGNVTLFRRSGSYECVVYTRGVQSKIFSIFRLTNEGEAYALFNVFTPKLNALTNCSSSMANEKVMQKVCDCMRDHQTWTTAHVAAFVGLFECFKFTDIKSLINSQCTATSATPMMAAIIGRQLQCVQELQACGASMEVQDLNGDTVYHYAVQADPKTIPVLTRIDVNKVMDWMNHKGQTCLSVACEKGLSEAVEELIQAGANPCISSADSFPIHLAVKAGYIRCVEILLNKFPDLASLQDNKNGGTPFHWARTDKMMELLCKTKCDVNVRSNTSHTPLHIMQQEKRIDCIMVLLCYGADARIADQNGDTPLHLAVRNDDVEMVRTLVVFGADVNLRNAQNQTARHIATVNNSKNKDIIIFILHVSGARRCSAEVKGCQKGCFCEGTYAGTPDETMKNMMDADKTAILDEMFASFPFDETLTKAEEAGFGLDSPDSGTGIPPGDRLLCLDGGGIRGLVLIQMLMAIEMEAGIPIKECFDWIGGTSTGGILALGIGIGKSLTYLKGLYFRLKDEVFTGTRPYATEPFEEMLKREFGDTKVMTDIIHPKVVVMGVYGDRHPTELHLFRTYFPTIQREFTTTKNGVKFDPPPLPNEQKMWQAARSSGAAPTYFRAHGRFVDGGMISNNPTLDMLTEIHEYNTGLKLKNEAHLTHPLACVVSLGTGRIPVVHNEHIDVYRPESVFEIHKVAKGISGLVSMLLDQATASEGSPVDRSRAWCSMLNVPFARFSPHLSLDLPLDCHDNKQLINMMWETQCYIEANKHRVQRVASMLRKYHRINMSLRPPSDSSQLVEVEGT